MSIGLVHHRYRTLLQDEEVTLESVNDAVGQVNQDIDTQFLLTSGYLVFFMQCGFAMLSAGSVRAKNAKNIVLKNLLDACFGGIGWYLTGYAFAYGEKSNEFVSYSDFALSDLPTIGTPERGYTAATWFFQYTFTATAATIVSGAVAERCKFEAYLGYALFLSMWVYPVVAHWVWGNGWASAFKDGDLLFDMGAYDFAGCGVVHMTGGFAALSGAAVLGPRLGRFNSKGEAQDLPGHNASLALLGVFILWFGWFGFNPGSALAISGDFSGVAAHCAVTTTLSAAAGTISALLGAMGIEYMKNKHIVWDLIIASNGTLGGLVGITSACSLVQPWAALIIGFIGGLVYLAGSLTVINVFKVDDPLDAVAVHGFCGMWGLLTPGIFTTENIARVSYDPDVFDKGKLFGANIVVLLVIAVWVMGHMVPFFYLMKVLGLFRVSAEEEHEGLDTSHHGGSAYPQDTVSKMGGESGGNYASADELAALKRQLRDIEQKVFANQT